MTSPISRRAAPVRPPARGAAPRRRLPRSFYRRPTLQVARDLLGQRLVVIDRGRRLSGWIVEAEAYIGSEDLGCHARVGRTERNRSMWGDAGHAYVYFTYGMHWCLNIVTERAGRPAAVLLRALAPAEGLPTMLRRRGPAARRRSADGSQARDRVPPAGTVLPPSALRHAAGFTDGPAKLCQALGIDRRFDGHDLCAPQARLFIEAGWRVPDALVRSGPRVGLHNVPEPWRSKPWRFWIPAPPSGGRRLAARHDDRRGAPLRRVNA